MANITTNIKSLNFRVTVVWKEKEGRKGRKKRGKERVESGKWKVERGRGR